MLVQRGGPLAWRRFLSSSRRLASSSSFDVLVVGGGPVGCELARLSATLGKSVGVVEADRGGQLLAAPTGWVSKAMRHASRELGTRDGTKRVPWNQVTQYVGDTAARALAMTAQQFSPPLGLEATVFSGSAAFTAPGTLTVTSEEEGTHQLDAETIFIASGSVGTRIPSLPWDKGAGWLFDADTIKDIGRLPEHIVIQGGGVIGVEYGFIMRRLGAEVTLVLMEDHVLDGKGVDHDIKMAVAKRLDAAGINVRFGDGVISEAIPPEDTSAIHEPNIGRWHGKLTLGSGARLHCDALLSAVGRSGNAAGLCLEAGGLAPATPRGHVDVDPETMQAKTQPGSAAQVYAAGDVAGLCAIQPGGLLSTGIAQAHLAVQNAFPDEWAQFMSGHGSEAVQRHFDPYPPATIWIEDGVGMVGLSQVQAAKQLPTDWGMVQVKFNQTIKACVQPRPDDEMLKLIFQLSTGKILGVHIFGRDAAEMIHHAGGLVNADQENTVWHVVRSVPPAVTYGEVLMKACQSAVEALGGGPMRY